MTESCRLCGAEALEPLPGFAELGRVTSDCRPWPAGGTLCRCRHCGGLQKPADHHWREEVASLYSDYALYASAGGNEQLLYQGDGSAATRSSRIFELLSADLPQRGRLLDFGSGNGDFVRLFDERRPGWRIDGVEPHAGEALRATLRPEGRRLLHDLEEGNGERYELITLIHVLEHLPEPLPLLASLADRLAEGGRLLIQVPDLERSPLDLVVADHCSHFTTATLGTLLQRSGLGLEYLSTAAIPKSITVILGRRPRRSMAWPENAPFSASIALAWLGELRRWALAECGMGGCAMLGTAMAAAWLHGCGRAEGREIPDFFVDEDPTRAGGSFCGRPVLSPAEVPAGTRLLLPFPPEVAAMIQRRLRLPGVRLLPPPPIPQSPNPPNQ